MFFRLTRSKSNKWDRATTFILLKTCMLYILLCGELETRFGFERFELLLYELPATKFVFLKLVKNFKI